MTAQPGATGDSRHWRPSLAMSAALLAVAAVWLLGCVWSFEEQTAFAAAKQFALPQLLPLVIDGFAISMAGVAWAASLDGRAAVAARLAMLSAVAASSASNGAWAFLRTGGDVASVALAVAVPIAANMAFEVLLAELRRQVQRRRGLPAPVAVPNPRLIRLVLAPVRTSREWRAMVLELTKPSRAVTAGTLAEPEADPSPATSIPGRGAAIEARDRRADPVRVQVSRSARVEAAAGNAPGPRTESSREHIAPATRRGLTKPGNAIGTGRPSPANGPAASRRAVQPPTAAVQSLLDVSRTDAVPVVGTDPRAVALAALLAEHESPETVTSHLVSALLKVEIPPRTSRRLLGEARQLLKAA